MREFYFLRHGQTDWNVEGRLQGRADIPLNAAGIAQAVSAARHYLKYPVDRIVSSPQSRAKVTAEHVAQSLNIPIDIDERLMERCSGMLDGMTVAEIERADPALLYDTDIANDWYPDRPMPRGGETKAQVAERAHSAVMDYLARHPNQKILFVAHGAWFRALVHRLSGEVIYSENATPYIFSPQEASWLIKVAK